MAGYLGSVPVPQATQHRETFTATAGQTTFNTAGYTPLFIDVYLNGVHLSPADVTATNGSDVVLAACLVNDIVDVVSYTPFEVASQTFTGTTTMTDVVAATLDISGNIDIDGTTNLDVVDIDGAVDMASTLGVAGVVTANAGVVVDNITIDGTEIDLSSGDLTLDVAGNIILDADGGFIAVKDAGTEIGNLGNSSSNFAITSSVQDKDIVFKGNDNGSVISALTLDMSAGGTAVFGGELHVKHSATSDSHYFQMENDNNNTYMYTSTSSSVNKGLKIYHANAGGALAFVMDSSGHITMPLQPAFHANAGGVAQTDLSLGTHYIDLSAERFDNNSDFTLATGTGQGSDGSNLKGVFTAPVTGKYQLNGNVRFDYLDSGHNYVIMNIETSNEIYRTIIDPDFGQDAVYWTFNMSVLADMDANDTVYLSIILAGGATTSDISGDVEYTNLSGYLVC